MGQELYTTLDRAVFPQLTFRSRSVKNIVYDEALKQYVLGGTTVTRSAQNVKHIRPFTQLVWLAHFVRQLLEASKTSTLRDVY
jgi:DNA topoisomerase-6 subunit A